MVSSRVVFNMIKARRVDARHTLWTLLTGAALQWSITITEHPLGGHLYMEDTFDYTKNRYNIYSVIGDIFMDDPIKRNLWLKGTLIGSRWVVKLKQNEGRL